LVEIRRHLPLVNDQNSRRFILILLNSNTNHPKNYCMASITGQEVPSQSVVPNPKLRDPCKKFACEIQHCLQAHQYRESSCQSQLDQMIQCCTRWIGKSVSCSGFVKQVEKEKLSQDNGV